MLGFFFSGNASNNFLISLRRLHKQQAGTSLTLTFAISLSYGPLVIKSIWYVVRSVAPPSPLCLLLPTLICLVKCQSNAARRNVAPKVKLDSVSTFFESVQRLCMYVLLYVRCLCVFVVNKF